MSASLPTTHVFFDFFGTLVDYDPSVHPAVRNAPHEFAMRAGAGLNASAASDLWERAWRELDDAARASGRECSMLEIAGRYAELVRAPGQAAGEPELERLVDDYLAAWVANVRLADAAAECLADLARDHTLAVVSNTHHPTLVQRQLDRFGIGGYFADVVTSIETGWRKPHPRIYERAFERTGGAAGQTLFVGDTWDADVAGPRALGMRAAYVGAPGPCRSPVALAELPALVRASALP